VTDAVRTLWDFLTWAMTPTWGGIPIVGLAELALVGAAYLAISRATTPGARTARAARALAVRQPGWLTRHRAAGGIQHRPGRVGVGYERAFFGTVHIGLDELNHHGYAGGASGSGKTTFLRGLIQGYPGPVIVLDCKGDPDLVETVRGLPGLVWEIGGPLRLDLLDPEPAILAQQLLEGEAFSDRGAVYRAIAEHAVIRAAHVLRWRSEPLELARILELVSSPLMLAEAIREAMPPGDRTAQRWLTELDAPNAIMREGFQTFAERLGSLLDSPAGCSLGSGPEAVRLADALASSGNGKLLIRLDPRYGAISRKVGAWVLVAMLRLAAELRQAAWHGRCLFVVDDPRLLKHEGRWLADLFGTARDAGIGLVVADQGIAGLAEVHPDLPDAVLRSTGWQLIFRQGSPADAEQDVGAVRHDLAEGRELRQRRPDDHPAPGGASGVHDLAEEPADGARLVPRRADRPGCPGAPRAADSRHPTPAGQTSAAGTPARTTSRGYRRAARACGTAAGAATERRGSSPSRGAPPDRAGAPGRLPRVARQLRPGRLRAGLVPGPSAAGTSAAGDLGAR
jgi:hypothetical protein